MQARNLWLLFVLFLLTAAACQHRPKPRYQRTIRLGDSWHQDTVARFQFRIPDTGTYQVFYHVRYSRQYPHYNFYTHYYLTDSAGHTMASSDTARNARPQQMHLFEPESGKPFGQGLAGVYDQRVLAFKQMRFPKPGVYRFYFSQEMRYKELPGLRAFGIEIAEK